MYRFRFIKDKSFDNLPKTSGVYSFFATPKPNGVGGLDEPIYIGKAVNIRDRVKNHFNGNNWWEKTLLRQGFAGRVGFIKTNSEIEALILEANLIKKYQPKFNVVWRDDKNYFYVAIAQAKNRIPYIYITHQPKNKFQIKYIGPFVEGTALKKTLRFLRRAFPYYTSATLRRGSGLAHPKLKCTYCHLNLCPGPRLFEARLARPSGEAANLIAEYKKSIKKMILILQGKRSLVLNSLKREMKKLSKENRFEEAAKTRDKIYNLQQVMSHTKIINAEKEIVTFLARAKKVTILLKNLLRARKPISRVECYDVSNIQGKFATGSMVIFVDGKPDKSLYKKFKIITEDTPNDIAMLKETLERRFNHPEWEYPEVILIDGGKAQLNVAIKTKNQMLKTKTIKVISIAKGRQELFIEGKNRPIALKNLPQEIYNLILQLDDEAHRFAITYHKKLRKNNLLV
ncbi:MAG: UvrB/UvrC motif-containing protein [Candidatus Staskawiczbacteria bacterium]|nr:UvrB/UvrC motif-containing protein [Candidatus Staskawiczbacteria bacterium]